MENVENAIEGGMFNYGSYVFIYNVYYTILLRVKVFLFDRTNEV